MRQPICYLGVPSGPHYTGLEVSSRGAYFFPDSIQTVDNYL